MGNRIYSIKRPNGGAIKKIGFERNISLHYGALGTDAVFAGALCAVTTAGKMASFTDAGTPKTVKTSLTFPIGSKIYRSKDAPTVGANHAAFDFDTSCSDLDLRYSCNCGSTTNPFDKTANTKLYLAVDLNQDSNGVYVSWSPRVPSKGEWIVDEANLEAGEFYIFLGYGQTADSTTWYMASLELDNGLYYFDSNSYLVDWASWLASQNSGGGSSSTYHKYNIFGSGNGVTLAASTNNLYEALNTHLSIPAGFYKVTMQLHLWWDNSTYNVAQNAEVLLKYYDSDNNTNLYLAGQTVVMTPMNSPNNMSYYLASNVVVLVGYLNLTAAPSANSGIGLRVKGKDGMKLGYSQPVSGDNQMFQKSTLNDFILMERLGDAV